MAASEVELWNQSLSAIGTSSISATTELSREAEVCRIWYTTVRDEILRAAFWPSTKKWARLAVVAERDFSADWGVDDPGPQWRFVYALPADIIAPRFLSTYGRFTIELYSPTVGAESVALMTDHEQVVLQYSKKQENVQLWDASLSMAITYGLAAHICVPLTGKLKLAQHLLNLANSLILNARQNTANENVEQYETIPDWIAARGYAEAAPVTKFLYPYGPALSISGEPGAVISGTLNR